MNIKTILLAILLEIIVNSFMIFNQRNNTIGVLVMRVSLVNIIYLPVLIKTNLFTQLRCPEDEDFKDIQLSFSNLKMI